MKQIKEIKNDLIVIRNYYDILKIFNGSNKVIMAEDTKEIINEYESVITHAPKRIQNIYETIYKSGKTKKEISNEIHRSLTFVKELDREFLEYLFECFKEEKR